MSEDEEGPTRRQPRARSLKSLDLKYASVASPFIASHPLSVLVPMQSPQNLLGPHPTLGYMPTVPGTIPLGGSFPYYPHPYASRSVNMLPP